MRDIKFRAYDGVIMYYDHSINININGQVCYLDYAGEWKEDKTGLIRLMQFTGLTDKSGKKIFEGDILKCPDGIGFVIWDETRWGIESPGSGAVDYPWAYFYEKVEVIGNIYENIELLRL